MNFGNIAGLGGAAVSYLATPEGQEMVKKFLATPDGVQLLKDFAMTAEGRNVIAGILPQILGGMNLPPGAADIIKNALGGQ